MSRRELVRFLIIILLLLSVSILKYEAFEIRKLKERMEERKFELIGSSSKLNNNDSFFATSSRVVPSCPDPLHNR